MSLNAAAAETPAPASCEVFVGAGVSSEARKKRAAAVAVFTADFVDLAGWLTAPLPERLATPLPVRTFIAWSVLFCGVAVDASYVAAAASSWGHHAALVHPQAAASFHTTATGFGYTTEESKRQWATLAKLVAITGLGPDWTVPGLVDT